MSSALRIPDRSLVVLVGASASGKSTFARAHFGPFEVVSSDFCRGLVSNDENDQAATAAAFQLLHLVVGTRLQRGLLTVVDATNVRPESRRPLLELAHHSSLPAVAIVLDVPAELCAARNAARTDRTLEQHVLDRQREQLHRSLGTLAGEGFDEVVVLRSEREVAAVAVERVPLPPDRRGELGPFDIIGDVHGCADELEELLGRLGYAPDVAGAWRHREGRRLVFIGDLVDRGPRIVDVLRLVMSTVAAGAGLVVPGNHDDKLLRKLQGRNVQIRHGLEDTLAQLHREPPEFCDRVGEFLASLVSHLVVDEGKLVVAHGGMPEWLQGRTGKRVRDFALFGATTGKYDEYGLPIRGDWAAEYRGSAFVAYGHTPVPEPRWMNRTVNIDTGCVFGGRLTALRWPECETTTVPARRVHAPSARPFPVSVT